MSYKLTLSVDEDVVAEAKAYAKQAGSSVSAMVEGYLKGLRDRRRRVPNDEMPPVLKRLSGCLRPVETEAAQPLTDIVPEKYHRP